jgi:hypothetical protein
MRTLLHAAIAALSVASISPAIAGGGEGTSADTQSTELPGMAMQAPNASLRTVAQDRAPTSSFTTQSDHTVSLFPPYNGNDGGVDH